MHNATHPKVSSGFPPHNCPGISIHTEEPNPTPESSANVPLVHDSSLPAKPPPPETISKIQDKHNGLEKSQQKQRRSGSPRGRRGDRDSRDTGSREMVDSWVAPEISARLSSKRIKVSDVMEWDTWIAPDLREEEERLERKAVTRMREKQREKERRKRNRRNRREAHNIDSWVAEIPGEDDDRERRTRGRSDDSPRRRHRDDSPRRSGGDRQRPNSQSSVSKDRSREQSRRSHSPRAHIRGPDRDES